MFFSIKVEQTITINETENPTASHPAAINVSCAGDVPLVDISVFADAADNCTATPTVAFVSDVETTPGTIIRTYSVTDTSGNYINVEQIITVNNTIAPEITCQSNITQTVGFGLDTAIVNFNTPVGTDNCAVDAVTQIAGFASGSAFPIGVTTITYEVRGAAGNSVTCSFDVIVEDEVVVDCSVDAGEDQNIDEGEQVELKASTSISGTLTWSPAESLALQILKPHIASPTETTTYTLSFKSEAGCTSEDFVTVYVTKKEEDDTKYGFSPDGDGINEFWEIDGIQKYPKNTVLIYNRWGDLVFETQGYNNTSNVFRGLANRKRNWGADQLPEGTYFFQIKIEGTHHLKKETGFLVLKR
ncbi:T9SS type B sorting domain-containing protein [Pseudotamlana haliotis]|nr:gliding motility-associated C-terminal domain-containing protein [Tamlana haliotis]